MSDASVRYGELVVFDSLSAVFRDRTVTALVGPSGSGKSSLLSAVGGQSQLSGGSIRFETDDTMVSAPDPTLVAWVPQSPSIMGSRTAIDNVLIAGLARGLSIQEATHVAEGCLADVGLASRALHRGKHLSGGEVQRVAFARALATEKPLILADEPSAGLDATNTLRLADLLHSIHDRATIIVATHDPVIVAAVDEVVDIRRPR